MEVWSEAMEGWSDAVGVRDDMVVCNEMVRLRKRGFEYGRYRPRTRGFEDGRCRLHGAVARTK